MIYHDSVKLIVVECQGRSKVETANWFYDTQGESSEEQAPDSSVQFVNKSAQSQSIFNLMLKKSVFRPGKEEKNGNVARMCQLLVNYFESVKLF